MAISFFTFQQIAYLVDSYRYETKEYDFLNYANFVTFFPQLIAGPIVHHAEMMPQFMQHKNKEIHYENIALGLFIFAIGFHINDSNTSKLTYKQAIVQTDLLEKKYIQDVKNLTNKYRKK